MDVAILRSVMVSQENVSRDDGQNPLAFDIISAVAEEENVDPTEVTPPLGTVIDVDALEDIIESPENDVAVRFAYREWNVHVTEDSVRLLRGPGERRSDR